MNIPGVMSSIIESLNESNNCGLCWEFVFGGRSDYFNLAKLSDCEGGCCVRVGVLDMESSDVYQQSGQFQRKIYTDWKLSIFSGVPSRPDIQFFDEVDEDKVQESKWTKILYPISCCMGDMPSLICGHDECTGGDVTIEIVKWDSKIRMNYQDNNYDGWLTSAVFRVYKEE